MSTDHVTRGRDGSLVNFDLCSRKMIADIFGESGDEEEEEFTVSVCPPSFVALRVRCSSSHLSLSSTCRASTRRTWTGTRRCPRRSSSRWRRSLTLMKASTAVAKSEQLRPFFTKQQEVNTARRSGL